MREGGRKEKVGRKEMRGWEEERRRRRGKRKKNEEGRRQEYVSPDPVDWTVSPTCILSWLLLRNHRQPTGKEVHDRSKYIWFQHLPINVFISLGGTTTHFYMLPW